MKKKRLLGDAIPGSPHPVMRLRIPEKLFSCFFLMFILQVFSLGAFAQSKTVTGVVRNEKGEPLAAVSIAVKGTTIVTSANTEGRFSIEVPAGRGTLVFTYIGYASKEVSVNNRTAIDIQLAADDSKKLDEVVVVGVWYYQESHINRFGERH